MQATTDAEDTDAEDTDVDDTDTDDPADATPKDPPSVLRRATLVGLALVVALAGLVGWLGFRAYESHQAQLQRSHYVQAARQSVLNLTTIDWQQADADVQRILDGATGVFYDDFAKRAQPFIDVVRQAKSTTVGTITEAGVESETADGAQVLVAVAVKTSNVEEPEQGTRAWRMRVTVQDVDGQAKASSVEFVA